MTQSETKEKSENKVSIHETLFKPFKSNICIIRRRQRNIQHQTFHQKG